MVPESPTDSSIALNRQLIVLSRTHMIVSDKRPFLLNNFNDTNKINDSIFKRTLKIKLLELITLFLYLLSIYDLMKSSSVS